jgi:UDP-N-acetylglucosamine transferase subunit ALG13
MGFDRMMQALEALPAEQLTVQHGPAPAPPGAIGFDFLPFGQIIELMQTADFVVSHAGVGSIMCALQAGHVPIVFPRYHRFGETVDDHQAELASALAERGTVIVASTGEQLLQAIASAPPRNQRHALPAQRLNAAVRAAIYGKRPAVLKRPSWHQTLPPSDPADAASQPTISSSRTTLTPSA